MHTAGARHRNHHHPRAVKLAALLTAAVAVVSLATVAPRAAHADTAEWLSVTPDGIVDDTPYFAVVVATGTGGHLTVKADGIVTDDYEDAAPNAQYNLIVDVRVLNCAQPDHVITATIDHPDPAPPDTAIKHVTLICPAITISPQVVAETDPVTITLARQDGFDALGPEQGDKSLYLDTALLGTFGYRQAPHATTTPTCGDHTIKLSQPSPYGPVEATAEFYVYCAGRVGWKVEPLGLNAPQPENRFTLVRTAQEVVHVYSAAVYLDDSTRALRDLRPVGGSFEDRYDISDGGDLQYAAAGVHLIHVKGTYQCNEFKTCSLDDRIPFYVQDPQLSLLHASFVKSALPLTQTVELNGFDGADDPYNRHPQPKTLTLDGQVLGTTESDTWTGAMDPPCGDSALVVTQPTSFGPARAETALSVLCPEVELSPAVISRDSQPRTLLLSGSSFHAPFWSEGGLVEQPYLITLDGRPVASDYIDEAGSFAATFPATGLACGPHDVTVTEQEPVPGGIVIPPILGEMAAPPAPDPDPRISLSTTLVVNCPSTIPPPVTTPPDRPHPGAPHGQPKPSTPSTTLDIQPQLIIAGLNARVTGTGFTPGHAVTLTWTQPDGSKRPACQQSVTASKDGTFVLVCQVTLHERVGPRTLTASDGTHTADVPALVITGPMQPAGHSRNPRLVIRH